MQEETRLQALLAAEGRAMALLDAIEARGLISPGRTEKDVEQDIYALAAAEFGVAKHWHKRIVRAGTNGLCISSDNPPNVTIGEDDMVFLDLGPVFEAWEADVGRTYVMGSDSEKHRLRNDLDVIFNLLKAYFDAHEGVTGAELYAVAQKAAEERGWIFGGAIAGHIVGEFPHAYIPGEKSRYVIFPENPTRMRDPEGHGRAKHWIIEVHLVDRARSFGGFYERLLVPA